MWVPVQCPPSYNPQSRQIHDAWAALKQCYMYLLRGISWLAHFPLDAETLLSVQRSTGKPSLGIEVDPEANAKTWLRVRGDETPSEEK